jgi:hypothetical protein
MTLSPIFQHTIVQYNVTDYLLPQIHFELTTQPKKLPLGVT